MFPQVLTFVNRDHAGTYLTRTACVANLKNIASFLRQSQHGTWAAMRNPDVEVKTVLTSSGVGHRKVHLEASFPVFGGLENTCRQTWNRPISSICLVLQKVQTPGPDCISQSGQHTVPARVTLWLLKPSRHVGKGNSLEDVHVSAEAEANVLPLHHATLGVHNPEL